jgi:leukotriene-A4 hydrolase
MPQIDPHSYYDTSQPCARHLRLNWFIDFERRQIDGSVTIELKESSAGYFDLDTKKIEIHSVCTQAGANLAWYPGDEEAILGRRLRLELPDGTTSITIHYTTSPEAVALQWFKPEMTLGKRQPFMYSQCQAIHARTIVPCQDTPRVRVSYSAAVTVPAELTAVMSAGPAGDRQDEASRTRTYLFEMPQPIPPYLLAIAAGDLQSRNLSPRSRVWAEPEMVDKAAYEFSEVEQMIETAEKTFGPYEWDRYDMLVLPPAFPYGGMENPRMTFLTPTVIAGDRSLVDVLAHELAHSWTGNLVTNATMDHFWLNEGFTTWAERRILDALHGEKASALRWAIGQKALEESVARFGADSPLTKLRTDLRGVDPDDAFSSIPYEKGARFVAVIERQIGRERFAQFMRKYLQTFRFTSITSEEFIAFLEKELPGISAAVDSEAWLHGTGIPSNAPIFKSEKLDELITAAEVFATGRRPPAQQVGNWDSNELLVFLQHLPRQLDRESLDWLDQNLGLTRRGNYEVLVEWLTIAAGSDYDPVFDRVREVLLEVGRMKYLRPLYAALGRHGRTQVLAKQIYEHGKASYHSLSRRVIETEIAKYDEVQI